MKRKKVDIQPTDEEVQEAILKYLANKRKKARGMRGISAKFSEIEKAVKTQFEREGKRIKRGQIAHNLDLLIQFGWVLSYEEEIKLKNDMKATQRFYKLSDEGIRYCEGFTSKFMQIRKRYFGINLSHISGIVVIGERNIVVNQNYDNVTRLLSKLGEYVANSNILPEEQLEMVSEIQTIESQLSKSKPNKEILKISLNNLFEKMSKYLTELQPALEILEKIKALLGV